MKKIKKAISLLLMLALLLSSLTTVGLTAFGDELTTGACGDNVTYSFDSSTGTLTISGTGEMADYDNTNQKSPFNTNTLIKKVVVEEGVTSIGAYAFYNCSGITEIIFSNTITSINKYAFSGCSALEKADFPKSLTKLCTRAFEKCETLKSIVIPAGLIRFDFGVFAYCYGLEDVTISNGVETIGAGAFYSCTGLTSVIIPDSVITIGGSAFANCTGLTSVQFGSSVTTIGVMAFSGCNNMHHYTLPESVTSIGINAFSSDDATARDNEAIRFDSNDYILPIARSVIYNNKIYTRFDKPYAKFKGVFSSYFKFAEAPDDTLWNLTQSLQMNGPRTYYIIGGQRNGGGWRWQYTGTAADTEGKWASGQPDNANNNENQLSFNSSNGYYNDINIDSTTPGFIACVDLDELKAQAKAISYYQTNKYVFYNNTLPFGMAKLIAEADGGYLATIAGAEEQNIIHNMVGNSYKVFLGGEKNAADKWEWLNGEGFNYTNWSSGEPSNYSGTGGQYYMAMFASGYWDDCNDLNAQKAAETNGFVVEYQPVSVAFCYTVSDGNTIKAEDVSLLATYPDGTTHEVPADSVIVDRKNAVVCQLSAEYRNERGEVKTVADNVYFDEDGVCGDAATYHYDAETATMTISGTGDIYDYSTDASVHFPNISSLVRYVVIGNGITSVGNNCFNGFTQMQAVSLPDSVAEIGTDAFADCSKLKTVNVPASLTTIGSYAFYRCAAFAGDLVLPITVTAIGKGAFYGCTALASVTVSNYTAEIGDRNSTFPTDTTLKGCIGSAVEQYAANYSRTFEGTDHRNIDETHYPTCVDSGYTEHVCTLCGYSYTDEETEPTGEHLYDEGMIIAPATQAQPYNTVEYTCTVCGYSYTEDVPIDGPTHIHQYAVYKVVSPTCAKAGYTIYRCDICGDKYDSDYINPNGHRWQQTAQVLPSCTENGYTDYSCSVCEDSRRDTLPATGHQYTVQTVSATCTEQGYSVYTCTVCGESYTDDYTQPFDHTFVNYQFNNDATPYFDGTETGICESCSATDTRPVTRTASLVSDTIDTVSGDEIAVPVAVKNNAGLAGFGIDVTYDASVLTPVSVTYGDVLSGNLNDSLGGNATAGNFKVMWYDEGGADMTDSGVLFYVHFTVDDHAGGETTVHLTALQDDTFDETFAPVALSACDAVIRIENVNENTWYHGVLTPSANEITAGDTFYLSLDKADGNADLTAATQTLTFDSNAFTFIGYADAVYQTIQTAAPVSNGTIRLVTANGNTYNENTPTEKWEKLGVHYLVFKAKDYATAGDYSFGYQTTSGTIDEVTADGCTITVNASAISDTAVIALPDGLTGNNNDTITVPVTITNNKGIMGYRIDFTYDATQLQIVSATCGTAYTGHFFNDTISADEAGTFSVLWCGTDEINDDGVLCTLTFNVLTNQTVTSPIGITYSQDDTFNIDYDDVVFNCVDGSIRLNDNHEHQYVATVVPPTPNTKGYTEYVCSVCGDTYRDSETDYTSDSSALAAALAKAAAIPSEDYSAASYEMLQQVCERDCPYLSGSYPQTAIDAATEEILTAITDLVPYLYLTVAAENGSVTVNGFDPSERYSVLFGDSITLTAVADAGYVFDGWYETVTKRIRSYDETLTFVITSNTDFEARFIRENSAVLTFANDSGWIAAKIDKTVSEWAQVTSLTPLLPRVPYKLGYTNGRWNYDNDTVLQQLQNGENVTITPLYDATTDTSPAIPVPAEEAPLLTLTYLFDDAENIGSFAMAAGIPENCQVASIGIAFYYKKAADFDPTTLELTINNKMTTSKFEATNESGSFTVDVRRFTAYYNWAARGYVTYYNSDGKLCTAYTNQVNVVDRCQVIEGDHIHSYVTETVQPACTTGGYTTYTCSGCGETYRDAITEPTGHNWTSEVTKSASFSGIDIRTYTCTQCGETETSRAFAETEG